MMIPMTEESIIEGSGNLGVWEFVWLLLLKQSVSENFLVAPHSFFVSTFTLPKRTYLLDKH